MKLPEYYFFTREASYEKVKYYIDATSIKPEFQHYTPSDVYTDIIANVDIDLKSARECLNLNTPGMIMEFFRDLFGRWLNDYMDYTPQRSAEISSEVAIDVLRIIQH